MIFGSNQKNQVVKVFVILFFQMILFHGLYGQALPPKQAYPLDVRQIHSGHSLTDPLFGQPWPGQYVNLITDQRGTWAGDDIGKSTIPGSPMFWRWDNETGLNPSARHDISDWELLVITEGIPLPVDEQVPPQITPAKEYLSRYANNAWNNGNNSNGAPTLLWTTWTNLDGAEGPWRATLDEYEILWEEMMDYANDSLPANATPIYIIPGHRMMAKLYDDIESGIVPGITSINEFFSDNIHTNSLGDYAIAMIHYACIYNSSPVGLPNELMDNPPVGFEYPSPELAAYLQDMVWEVVTNYSRTGVNSSLPIELVEFIAEQKGTDVELRWSTASELNNSHFEVEHSLDFASWDMIGEVPGNGTSTVLQSYVFTHVDPFVGDNIYRLKQVDEDGNFSYSEAIVLEFNQVSTTNTYYESVYPLYPNPTKALVNLRKPTAFKVYNPLGEKVLSGIGTEIVLDNLSPGIYFVELNRELFRLVKN